MDAMSATATMGAEPLTPPQESAVNAVDTEMTCLLTSDPEDRSIRSLSPDEMSNFNNPYYSSNGEAGPSGPRRSSGFGGQGGERSSSQAAEGTNPGAFSSFGNYASPTAAEGGMFSMSPTGMGGVGPNTNYGPTPFGVAPPTFASGPQGRLNSFQQNPNEVILSAVNPGPVYPTNEQLEVAFGYGLRREDGSFTRLIPADTLPPQLTAQLNLPPRQGSEGLIIVQPPRQPSPNSRHGAPTSVPRTLVARLPVYNPAGPQYTASPPAHAHGSINSIVAQSFSPTPGSFQGPRPRREKVYCDKWLHDGVCAFTQMGCRYKHEMPLDRATQISLGLAQGLPAWYRRAQAVELHPRGAMTAGAINSPPPPVNRMQGSWRREEGAGYRNMGSPPPYNPRQHALGPIGPPPPPPRDLKREEGEVDEYGEELLWKREGKGKGRQDEGSA